MERYEREKTCSVFEGLLLLISDAEEQIRYEQEVPIADVPAELVCMWFDDHFHPEYDWFSECFSAGERDILMGFHRFYEGKLKLLPGTHRIAELHQSQHWKEIMDRAGKTLRSIDWAA